MTTLQVVVSLMSALNLPMGIYCGVLFGSGRIRRALAFLCFYMGFDAVHTYLWLQAVKG